LTDHLGGRVERGLTFGPPPEAGHDRPIAPMRDAMRGRKPAGPELVQQLEGSAAGKKRAEVILRTVAGQLSVAEASALLEITPQRLHVLREEGLQALVDQFEPRPMGRPRKEPGATVAALDAEIERLQQELEAARLREEIALLLPGRQVAAEAQKKGRRKK
jgi:hypothetical protein